ncbi:type I-E CRISPR-associated endoribonuclease Cas2e [Scrofimicrobium canadense]|nr:type I-E CRISPR-associated endoribonuclease Cas2e [Scrofimicrobium canadense]
MVLVLSACPAGLRGDLTKWLLEVSSGVFVGKGSARLREEIWKRVCELCRDGRAIMIYSSDGEQRLRFKVHRHEWEPVDLDGLILMKRKTSEGKRYGRRTGWSNARASRRARTPAWSRQRGKNDNIDE